jgi:hypothetical protein
MRNERRKDDSEFDYRQMTEATQQRDAVVARFAALT